MIPSELFFSVLASGLKQPLDLGELRPIVEPGSSQSMQINAGAGTGKTTALTLKCLHAVFVEGLPPSAIVATTFTRKAARELQSRILSLGEEVLDASREYIPAQLYETLRFLDLNTIVTGTLDAIVQEVLAKYREPLNPPPLPIEDFVAKGLLLKAGLFPAQRYASTDLENYIDETVGPKPWGWSKMRWLLGALYDIRAYSVVNDVDLDAYRRQESHPGCPIAFQAISDFESELNDRRLADYLAFNRIFLERLREGGLAEFASEIRLMLIDEYQDTEFLQERIYFELADSVLAQGGAVVVVGDDDQALYRFRHATVGLFVNFAERFSTRFPEEGRERVVQRSLITNRRSTRRIISCCNDYLENDPGYHSARTLKPRLYSPSGAPEGDPVYLVCADGAAAQPLAAEVAELIYNVATDGWRPHAGGKAVTLDREEGTPGDLAIIAQTVREEDSGGRTFIGHLRSELESLGGPKLFNPRGRELSAVPEVGQILGLLMLAMDPDEDLLPPRLPRDVAQTLRDWRQSAATFLGAVETPSTVSPGVTLKGYLDSFGKVKGVKGKKRSLIVSEVLYRLATWIDYFHDDIEGLAYFELLQRGLVQAQALGSWSCKLVYDGEGVILASVTEVYWNYLVPLAAGEIDVDEDLLVTLPRDRVPALTVHQAKGLEYPLVIVDVGSRIKDRRSKQFYRWPDKDLDQQNRLRSQFGEFSAYRGDGRELRDERFDDLVRKYFVAFSRAAQVLVLCAHRRGIARRVENVGVWFDRDGRWGERFYEHVETVE